MSRPRRGPVERASRPGGRWPAELALLAVALASGLGLLRLTTSPLAASSLLSVCATVVAGQAVVALVQRQSRLRLLRPLAALAGAFAVGLVTAWVSVPFATRLGVPTASTVHDLLRRFDQAGAVIRSHPTPLPATSGVVLCIMAGAGLVSVVARTLWGWSLARPRRSGTALVALVPTFGLFAYSALLSSGFDRVQGTVAYLATAGAFLALADRPSQRDSSSNGWRHRVVATGGPAPPPGSGVTAAAATATLAVLIALTAGPALSAMQLDALPFHSNGGPAVAGARGAGGRGPGAQGSPGPQARAGSPAGGGSGSASGTASADGANGAKGKGAAGASSRGAPTRGTSGAQGAGTVGAIALVDDLQGVLSGRSQQVMFVARSRLPTYWQLATLTTFTGAQWVADPATAQIGSTGSPGSPGSGLTPAPGGGTLPVLPEPQATSTYLTEVSLEGLGGALLPVPPTTVSVSGTGAAFDPAIGAVRVGTASPGSGRATRAGFRYSAEATTPVLPGAQGGQSTQGAQASSGTSAAPPSAELAPYLVLPGSLPIGVSEVARQVTSGATGALAEAEALARWFDGGNFRYTLDPPTVPGEDPLSSFLFVTRAGFCQQFAGAYAVMARSLGLPTRLAVGFTTGTLVGSSTQGQRSGSADEVTYRVTGADAHVWPEVYLGPTNGWVSFEPTPPAPGATEGVGVLSGSAGPSSGGNGAAGAATQPRSVSSVPAGGTRSAGGTPASGLGGSRVVAWGGAGLAMVALLVLVGFARRHRRTQRSSGPPGASSGGSWRSRRAGARSPDPGTRVLARFERASRSLRRAGVGRQPSETVEEHVERLSERYEPDTGRGVFDTYSQLVLLAQRAGYSSEECSETDALEAKRLCEELRSALRRREDVKDERITAFGDRAKV